MKRLFSLLTVLIMMCVTTAVPEMSADHRGNSRSERQRSGVSHSRPGRTDRGSSGNSRPGASSRPSGGNNGNQHRPGSTVRPGGNDKKPDTGVRPGQTGNTRPGNTVRPGQGGSNKPGHGDGRPNHNTRPGNTVRPGHNGNFRPGHNGGGAGVRPSSPRPGMGSHHRPGANRPGVVAPPPRPGRPHFRPWVRPVPPAGWRPVRRVPLLRSFLGLSFGLSIDMSLRSLRSGAYIVDGYGNDQIHLRNVREQGFYWPDATLYYSGGGLQRSQFYYSTMGNFLSAYNQVFATLNSTYGAPVEMNSNGASCYARWFGYDGDYITLEYMPMNSSDGLRYFTILTYGN